MTWWERIEAAEARGRFTEADELLAADWVTCACGEQDDRIPRHGGGSYRFAAGRPYDETLALLGRDFYQAVKRNNASYARRVLTRIEARSAKILAELA
jgi:hypothetical protein